MRQPRINALSCRAVVFGAAIGRPAWRLALPALLAALALFPLSASADEPHDPEIREGERFSFDAFGTLGLVYSTEDRADYVSVFTRPEGPGGSETVSAEVDSIFGGQATFRATSRLTAVVQVVVEQTTDDDYTPQIEWANLRYDVTPDFSVRAGRMAIPAFMVSEYRKVSFANPWVRPPVELYSLVPVFTLDGVEATYIQHVGDWSSSLGVSFGDADVELPGDAGPVEAQETWNVNGKLQRGSLTARVAVARGLLDFDAFNPFFAGFRAFGPEGEAIADRFEVDRTEMLFATVGAEYDPGRWFVLTELGWSDTHSVFGAKAAGYLTAGYRWGSITPYATYSRSEKLSQSSAAGLSLSNLPPHLAPMAGGLNATLNRILASSSDQQNLAIGGRWDFMTGMALKLQVDFIDAHDDSTGLFINRQPGFEPGASNQVVSFATVFVF